MHRLRNEHARSPPASVTHRYYGKAFVRDADYVSASRMRRALAHTTNVEIFGQFDALIAPVSSAVVGHFDDVPNDPNDPMKLGGMANNPLT
jgi:Asp-tRNA(Asn)/Glu-tRNA(Gln) amidotransferase A subunit family amidase